MNKLSLALLLAATSGACVSDGGSTDAAEPSSSSITSDLDKANGGFTVADEAEQFGAPALFDDAELEVTGEVSDAMAGDAAVQDMQARSDVALRNVVMMWGQLPADPTRTTPTDWTGRLSVSRGAILIHHRIGFEDRTDAVLPRDTRASVSFISVTTTHSDGLALRIIDPTPTAAEPLTLTYSLRGGAQYTIDVAALTAGPQVVDVDGDNKLVAVSVQHRADCDAGAMRGRWRKVAPNLGHFLGVVADRQGADLGHVRGIFGERNGTKVLFGKFIGVDGAFKGLMVGSYDANGTWSARWLTRAGEHGVIRGVYRAGEGLRARHGGFLARWAETGCSDDPAPPSN
jgi:hypothetical protein